MDTRKDRPLALDVIGARLETDRGEKQRMGSGLWLQEYSSFTSLAGRRALGSP